MENNNNFDFTVDKATQTAFVNRTFNASQDLVWDAFTTKELLDQWWAPKPFLSRTKYMNFEEGGKRFYAMVTPDGFEKWSLQTYSDIQPKNSFKMYTAFADEHENVELPGSEWTLNFSEQNGITQVHIEIYNESLERMERMIAMGFKEGFTATLKYLEEVLSTIKK